MGAMYWSAYLRGRNFLLILIEVGDFQHTSSLLEHCTRIQVRVIAFWCLPSGLKFPVNFNWEWDFQQSSSVCTVTAVIASRHPHKAMPH